MKNSTPAGRTWLKRVAHFLRRENLHRVLMMLVVLTLLCAAGLWFLEPQTSFPDWLWWSVVTITTVGYGDFTPITGSGRLIGILLMFCGIGALSTVTATIASFFVEVNLKRERGMKTLNLSGHYIICEWNSRAAAVYNELRSDPRCRDVAIVVVAQSIDSKPVDDDDLYFVYGEANEENLNRASVETASTVIILGDDRLDPGARDAKVVLSTLTVEGLNRQAYTVVEVVREENGRHCERAHADEIIIGNEFSSRLLATAAVDHGITKVLSELLSVRYGNDLQIAAVPDDLVGRSFLDVATEMKQANESIVLAVYQGGEVITNPPAALTIDAGNQLIVISKRSDRN